MSNNRLNVSFANQEIADEEKTTEIFFKFLKIMLAKQTPHLANTTNKLMAPLLGVISLIKNKKSFSTHVVTEAFLSMMELIKIFKYNDQYQDHKRFLTETAERLISDIQVNCPILRKIITDKDLCKRLDELLINFISLQSGVTDIDDDVKINTAIIETLNSLIDNFLPQKEMIDNELNIETLLNASNTILENLNNLKLTKLTKKEQIALLTSLVVLINQCSGASIYLKNTTFENELGNVKSILTAYILNSAACDFMGFITTIKPPQELLRCTLGKIMLFPEEANANTLSLQLLSSYHLTAVNMIFEQPIFHKKYFLEEAFKHIKKITDITPFLYSDNAQANDKFINGLIINCNELVNLFVNTNEPIDIGKELSLSLQMITVLEYAKDNLLSKLVTPDDKSLKNIQYKLANYYYDLGSCATDNKRGINYLNSALNYLTPVFDQTDEEDGRFLNAIYGELTEHYKQLGVANLEEKLFKDAVSDFEKALKYELEADPHSDANEIKPLLIKALFHAAKDLQNKYLPAAKKFIERALHFKNADEKNSEINSLLNNCRKLQKELNESCEKNTNLKQFNS